MIALKENLSKICSTYIHSKYLSSDPILFPYRYSNREDIEFVSLVTALFSYGNIDQIKIFLEKLLKIFGDSPKKNLLENSFSIPDDLYYRFQKVEDIRLFFQVLRDIYTESDGFEKLFFSDSEDTQEGILNFQKRVLFKLKKYTKKPGRGLFFLVGKGLENSPNKRYHMFLRWMVRRDFPDFGLYSSIEPDKLLFPLDTHIQKLSKLLGFYSGSSSSYRVTKKITNEFKKLNPTDPLLYDFPLSRLGILKKCKSTFVFELCNTCNLKSSCIVYARPR